MKIKGQKITACNVFTVVIPKADNEYVFQVGPANMDNFELLCPRPEAPTKIVPGSSTPITDVNNKDYKLKIDEYAEKRMAYMFVSSLSHTEELEFDSVDMSDSDTWKNYTDELKEAGFTDGEIVHLLHKVISANGLNNSIIDKATDDFLALKRQQELETANT